MEPGGLFLLVVAWSDDRWWGMLFFGFLGLMSLCIAWPMMFTLLRGHEMRDRIDTRAAETFDAVRPSSGVALGFGGLEAEERGGGERELERSVERLALENARLEYPVSLRRGIDVEGRGEAPAIASGVDEAVVLQVIVGVRDENREDDPLPQLDQITLRVRRDLTATAARSLPEPSSVGARKSGRFST